MARAARLQVEVVGDTRSVEAAMARASRATSRFGRTAVGQTGAMAALRRNFALVATAAGAFAIVGLKRVTDAAAESEASAARLGAQLQTLGKNTAGVRSNIESTVQSISRLSGFDDEDLQDAFTGLVRTTGDVAKAQGQLGLVADIARGRQISLSTATAMVNRANVGSIGGLKRLGIEVDKNTTKEQAFALLRQKFAGQAEAFGNTAAGAQARLGVATENAMEQVGVALTPVIIAFADFASTTLPRVVNWVMQNKDAVLALAGAFGALLAGLAVARAINTFALAFGVLNTVMNANPILRIVSLLILLGTALVTAYQTSSTFRAIVTQAFTAIRGVAGPVIAFFAGPAKSAFDVIRSTVQLVAAILRGDFSAAWTALKGIASAVITGIVTIIKGVPTAIWTAATGILTAAYRLGQQVVEWIAKGIGSLPGLIKRGLSSLFGLTGEAGAINPYLPQITGQGAKVPEAVAQGIAKGKNKVSRGMGLMIGAAATDAKSTAPGKSRPVGNALSDGIAEGVRASGSNVGGAIAEVIREGIAQGKREAGIRSPSEVMKRLIGHQLVSGLVLGIEQMTPRARAAMAKLLGGITAGANTRAAFENLRSQAASSVAGLVDMYRQARVAIYSAQAGFAGGSTALNDLRANYAQTQDLRREAQLKQAVADAEANADATAAERKAASDALADYYTEKEIARLEAEAAKQAETDSKAITSLANRFQQGEIDAATFQSELQKLIGGETGATLGNMFGTEWATAFSAAIAPVLAIIQGGLGASVGPNQPDTSIREARLADWNAARQAFIDARAAMARSGKKLTDAEKKRLREQYGADSLAGWERVHPRPLARGGILRRPILAGEAGAEAVIPLTGGRGRDYMSRVMNDVMQARRGGATVVVNVAGNEFSAEEFARKVGPELRRQVALTGSF